MDSYIFSSILGHKTLCTKITVFFFVVVVCVFFTLDKFLKFLG